MGTQYFVCTRCKEEKAPDFFTRNAHKKSGLSSWCKVCAAWNTKRYADANRIAIAKKRRAAYNSELDRIRSAKWRSENKALKAEIDKKYRESNREKIDARISEWRKANSELVRGYQRKYRETNLEKCRIDASKWAKLHPQKITQAVQRYQAAKLQAVPAWAHDEINELVVDEMYDLSMRRTKVTGIPWHVDHVVPLRSRVVCGLHCGANMQVIPGADNFRKGNRVWPDMP